MSKLSQNMLTFDKLLDGKLTLKETVIFLDAQSSVPSALELFCYASSLRERMISISGHEDAIDICGTGGCNTKTFNVTTASAFVIAAAEIKVAKHSNKSSSGKAGSADVLTSLGVDHNKNNINDALDNGLGFLYAPDYHTGIKHAAQARKTLKRRTIFNILGPMCNPAKVKKQVIGVYDFRLIEPMSQAMRMLGSDRVLFVSGSLDEYDVFGDTHIIDSSKSVTRHTISSMFSNKTPKPKFNLTTEESAQVITDAFSRKGHPIYKHMIINNAALGIYLQSNNSLDSCKRIAAKCLTKAKNVLDYYKFGDNKDNVKIQQRKHKTTKTL